MKLSYAIKNDELQKAKDLIKSGIEINSPDKKGYTPLHWAVIKNRLIIVKLLIQNGADIEFTTSKGLTAIELAIYTNRPAIVRFLLDFVNNKQRNKLLHVTAALNNLKILGDLLKFGLDVNLKDESGRTAMHWAAQEGSLKAAKVLVNYQANIDLFDEDKFSPLAIAVGEGHIDFTKFLIKMGVNVNRKVSGGGTVLHLAYAWNRDQIIDVLLRSGARLDIIDEDGKLPTDYTSKTL